MTNNEIDNEKWYHDQIEVTKKRWLKNKDNDIKEINNKINNLEKKIFYGFLLILLFIFGTALFFMGIL